MGDGVTYPEVGATEGVLPPGYHHLRRQAVVGHGCADFDEVARRVLSWEVQRRSGIGVRTPDQTVREGSVAVLRLGWGRVGVNAPVQVVRVVSEPRRQGFAYGTLPGHPERGEESFVVELGDGGEVTFAITAFSRPATVLAGLGGPLTRWVQSRVTERYLASMGRG